MLGLEGGRMWTTPGFHRLIKMVSKDLYFSTMIRLATRFLRIW